MSQGPLAGLIVLDLTMFIAGPFGSQLLADLGARVIKVEPITGDPVRSNMVGPQVGGENAQFVSVNHGKESIAMDLKSEDGQRAFRDLVAVADVVYDNYRPDVRRRLGIDRETLSGVNHRIITCSISGYGQEGEWSRRPAYDLIVQALSGVMSITGSSSDGPARVGYQIGDLAGGLYSVIGILSAIYERGQTGRGREVEVSLLDAQIALLADEVTHHYVTGEPSGQWGGAHPHLVPYQVFDTSDDPIVVAAVGREAFWERLCRALGLSELAADDRYRDNSRRVENRGHLVSLLAETFATRGREEWLGILDQYDVPAAPVNSVGEALGLPVVGERAMVRRVPGYDADVRVAGNPIRSVDDRGSTDAARSPRLGADTRAVLADLAQYDEDEINRLIGRGVVTVPQQHPSKERP